MKRLVGLRRLGALGLAFVMAVGWIGCARYDTSGRIERTYTLEVTAYCPCGTCCNWKRNWYGRPVYASGPLKGKPKKVGVTASGTRAHKGTIAADTRLFPFGTIMEIPGYGYGQVEDRGGAIAGRHIDVYFSSHEQALEWGRKRLRVRVWLPPR